jgi:Cu(I)/Ag(I) efflux system periplasmic protein CusF
MSKREIIAAGSALLIVVCVVQAQPVTPTVKGTIIKIDQPLGKITLKHGEIPNLHMEAMTMVFAMRDRKMLDGLKAGDNVRFEAEEVNGMKTVTEIQSAR